jgi:hypothetical protein
MSERYGAIESCIELARLESVRRNFEDDAFEAYRTNSSLDFLCFNATGSTLTKGTVVYISGVQGDKPKVVKADASTEMTSSKVVGLVFRDIPDMEEGLVIEAGELIGTDGDELDTSAFTAGDLLWLSTTAGEVTNVRPTQPDHAVFIGYCLRSHPNAGAILVNIINGFELDELHDVLITTPTDGQVLAYESSTSLWKNVTPSGGGGVEVLGSDFTDIDATDTTANALSVTIPAGKLGANGDSLSIRATMSVTGTTGSFTIAPTFGANAMGTISLSSNGTYLTNVDIVRTSSTSFRASLGGVSVATNVYTSVTGLSAGWFDSNRTFEFDISTNNADRTITFRFGRVEFLPSP